MNAFATEPSLKIARGIESASFSMSGKELAAPGSRAVARSINCSFSSMELVAVGGAGFTRRDMSNCTLTGFDQVRNGGQLPSTIVGFDVEAPLAGKLVTLLELGAKKGGLGVKKTDGGRPPCCDIPSKTTYELSDDTQSLVCVNSTGGFAFIVQSSCTFTKKDTAPATVEYKGKLARVFGIGGESTGMALNFEDASAELVLSAKDRAKFVDGRVARVIGSKTTLSGVETHDRPAIKVSSLLVCPAPKTTLSLMPPVDADTSWLGANCPDLDLVY